MELIQPLKNPIVCRNFVGGRWQESSGAICLEVKSPYSGAPIAKVPVSSTKEVEQVINAATAAFPAWRSTPIKERTQLLFRFRELVLNELNSLANTVALESGKTVAEGRAGIMKGLEVVEFALALQNSAEGGRMEVSRGVFCETQREPLGVVVGITPFNFPAMVPLWMYPIALALGNCFVLKPSEKVPLTSQRMAELLHEAGFPAGVFSIVNGDKSTVEALIDHAQVQAVAFVGSTPAAKAVYQRATHLGKRALCLGGAKNAIILAPDADPHMAASGILASFTGCAGQRCMAASLVLAVGNVQPAIDALVSQAQKLQPGTGLGAIIDRGSLERITREISEAEKQGAKILLDGRASKAPAGYENGNWLAPTIIDFAKPSMRCAQIEIFGPVVTIIRVNSLSEALEIEASLPYGNATSVFTRSGQVARFVSDRASTGMIGVNIGVPVPREPFSFGGTKESKFGSGDITGYSSLDLWSNLKKITSKWDEQTTARSAADWMS